MPQTLETDGLNIEFPDSFTLDQITEWTRNELPSLRERVNKNAFQDLASRIPRDAANSVADDIMAVGRAHQFVRDNSVVANLRSLGMAAAMTSPVGEEHAVISAANQVADTTKAKQDATREQRLRDNPIFKFGADSKQNAQEFYQTNPTRDTSIPAMLSQTAPRLVEAAALESIAAPIAVVAQAPRAVKAARTVLSMLSAGAAFGVQPEGKFDPTQAAIAAGTVPAFGAGELLATKILERLPIKSVNFELAPNASKTMREAQALGQTIEKAPEGFTSRVEQKLGGISIGETGRKVIENTGGILAANAYLTAIQAPEILKLPEKQRGAAIADLIASQAAMSLLGYLPVLGSESSKANREIWNRIAKETNQKYGAEPNSEPPSPVAGLPEPPPPGLAPSEFAAPVQPSPEQKSAAEADAVAEIQRRMAMTGQQAVVQTEVPPIAPTPVTPTETAPKRRSPAIVPETERPYFRPPTPASPPMSIPSTSNEAAKMDIQSFTGPPEAQPNAPVPEATTKGEIQNAKKKVARPTAGGESPPPVGQPESQQKGVVAPAAVTVQAPALLDKLALDAVSGDQSKIDLGRQFALSGEYTDEAISKAVGSTDPRVANLLVKTGVLEKTQSGNYQLNPAVYANDIERLSIKPIQPQEPNAISVRSPEALPLEKRTQGSQEVGGQIRNAEKPALPQNEASQVERKVEPSAENLSVTVSEPKTVTGVTAQDIELAFPSVQGFSVKPVEINWANDQKSNGYLVRLPNGQVILIDPTKETISFDPNKAAADWGLDPTTVAERGIATGKWTRGGATIEGLDSAGLIELLNTSGPDTLSHEKFHALFQLALTEPEQQAILKRYGTEEKAAEAFRRSEGFTRTFWEKIKRFLEWLSNLVRGDAFNKLKTKLNPEFKSEATTGDEKLSLDLSSNKAVEERISKPFISPEETTSLQRQAGAGAGLVPDAIAREVSSLNVADPVEKRMAGILDFVLKLHGAAPALELKRILDDPSIPEDTKQASISNVLRQIENVRVQTDSIEEKLQEATKDLASAIKQGGKITAKRLVEGQSKQIAANLITGYRDYLTAQAANLPANQNLAAARTELINGMNAVLDQEEKLPDANRRALEAIANRIDELPVDQGPQAVIDVIRQKDILRGKVGDDTINLLTKEQPGGLPPLLLNPNVNQQLIALADLQKKADTYVKQIEMVEHAFSGTDEPTPVELKKFAEAYHKFRNKQADAAKAIAEIDKEFRKASENVQVFDRTHDILNRLQNDPQFKEQFESAIDRPGGHVYDLFKDLKEADKQTGLITFISPLKQTDENGKESQSKYTVSLAPDRTADAQTISNMENLIGEIDRFLEQPNIDPIEARSWKIRRDYIEQFVLPAAYGMKQVGQQLETRYGVLNFNAMHVVKLISGGSAAAPRSELERMSFRSARDLNDDLLTTDLSRNQLVQIGNNPVFGDEITKVLALKAVESHKFSNGKNWGVDKRGDWKVQIANPIIAAGQAPGQLRLVPGSYIPGTELQVTKEDYAAIMAQKRFSQSVVNVTQGTAKKLPPALVHNPILIEDTFAGKKIRRGAFSTGPLTMARRFSAPGIGTTAEWFKLTTNESRLRLIQEGLPFESAALSYVTTTNPEFNRKSSLNPVYESYTANAVNDPAKKVSNYDQLVDRLSEIAVDKKLFHSMDEARTAISGQLFSEISAVMEGYHNAVKAETPAVTSETNPKTLMDFASAANAFTRRRGEMLGPDAFYDYTLVEGNDRIGFVAAAYQQFQLRNIAGLNQFIATLKEIEKSSNFDIDRLKRVSGVSHRKAVSVIQAKSIQQLEEKNLSYLRLGQAIRTLEKVTKALNELVIDRRDKNDAFMLYAMSRFQSTLSSALLATPTSIANNLAGGILTGNFILHQNIGRANLVLSQVGSAKHTIKTLVNRVIRLTHSDSPIGAFARSNVPLLSRMAKVVDEGLRESMRMQAELESWGLRSVPDKKSRLAAMAALKATGGAIETGDISALPSALNYVGTFPGLRQFLVHLRDLSPRVIDELINETLAESYRRDVYDNLRKAAVKAFDARKQKGQSNDFSKLENLLTPSDLGMSGPTGYRDLENLRDLFHSMGSLDTFLNDYYKRWDAAPEGEKANAPLFTSPEAEGQITFNLAAHSNIPTAGFTPPSMQGVGQRGLIKRILFMFANYVRRMAEQIEKTGDFDLRDPKVARRIKFFWQTLSLLIVAAVAGGIAYEVSSPIVRLITGRSPAKLTLANVLADPDAATVSRYIGMTLANNFPYYGGRISEMLGNPGYGSAWDVANLIPGLGLIRDAALTVNKISQTKDPLFPLVDFASRWFPPLAPAIRFLPGVEGDIEAKNAARALRVVGPSVGLELAPSGGAPSTQSPTSASIRRLIAAAYRGDQQGVQEAFDQAVQEKRDQGNPAPEKAVVAAIASREPARAVFGRAITPEEEALVMSKMSAGQRADYQGSHDAFTLINQTLGTKYSLTNTPKARTPSQPSRRALFTDNSGPSFPRLRLTSGKRRRPFAHLQIRGAQRKRRSPARTSFAA